MMTLGAFLICLKYKVRPRGMGVLILADVIIGCAWAWSFGIIFGGC